MSSYKKILDIFSSNKPYWHAAKTRGNKKKSAYEPTDDPVQLGK